MAKLKTERIIIKDGDRESLLDFKVDIHVDQQGCFTTTLPTEIALKFKNAGVPIHSNGRRNGKPGYFSGHTLEDLVDQIKKACKIYTTRTLISEKIVIRYVIETGCSYIKAHDHKKGIDVFFPNGHLSNEQGYAYEEYGWSNGTRDNNAANPVPFGFRIWTDVNMKREYAYLSRENKIEFDDIDVNKKQKNLYWLNGIASIRKPEGKIQEIDYTEDVAGFFVNMYKAIFLMNERVKEFMTPDGIKQLIDSKKGFNLLT